MSRVLPPTDFDLEHASAPRRSLHLAVTGGVVERLEYRPTVTASVEAPAARAASTETILMPI